MLKAGKYLARIVDYGVSETAAGKDSIFIKFRDNASLTGDEITWFGIPIKKDGNPNEIVIEQLFDCGFDGTSWDGLTKGPQSGVLITDEDIEITVADEINHKGAPVTRVKYIGGGGKEIKRVAHAKFNVNDMSAAALSVKTRKKPRAKKTDVIPF